MFVLSRWKSVNKAIWIELSEIINTPSRMYTHISIDWINPVNVGSALNSIRSSHLADIITQYRTSIDIYHGNIIKD
jgi:hypothetical protein